MRIPAPVRRVFICLTVPTPTPRHPTGRGLLLFNLRLQVCRGFDGFTVASLTNGCPGNCVESDYGAVLKGFDLGDFFIPQTSPAERESADDANQSEYLQSGLFCRATKLFCVELNIFLSINKLEWLYT